MNKFINTKTRAVIETACELKGGNWEKVDNQPNKTTETLSKPVRKKRGEKNE